MLLSWIGSALQTSLAQLWFPPVREGFSNISGHLFTWSGGVHILQGRQRGDQAEGGTGMGGEGGGPGGPSQPGPPAASRTTTASTLSTQGPGLRTSCEMCTWYGASDLKLFSAENIAGSAARTTEVPGARHRKYCPEGSYQCRVALTHQLC